MPKIALGEGAFALRGGAYDSEAFDFLRSPKHFLYNMGKGCGSGSWERERWRRLNFCESRSGSTLKKEARSARKSEATSFIWNWKRKQKYSTVFTSLFSSSVQSKDI